MDTLLEPTQKVAIRSAEPEDYEVYARLFPELDIGDAVPTRDNWVSNLMPTTSIATREGVAVGYCQYEEFESTGYVRNVVVAPEARRQGVGRQLMAATAQHFRSGGKRSWRLNVKPDNRAAIALYERFGLREQYRAKSLRLAWGAVSVLPTGSATVRVFGPARDPLVEDCFGLPRGQLAANRSSSRVLLEATSAVNQKPLGVAVFAPAFPGAFPFRVRELHAVSALLATMRTYVPKDEYINLVAEGDPLLANLLLSAGATLRDDIQHMAGELNKTDV